VELLPEPNPLGKPRYRPTSDAPPVVEPAPAARAPDERPPWRGATVSLSLADPSTESIEFEHRLEQLRAGRSQRDAGADAEGLPNDAGTGLLLSREQSDWVWTPAADARLMQLFYEHTENKTTDWVGIAASLGRWWPTASDCRARYTQIVAPQVRASWSKAARQPLLCGWFLWLDDGGDPGSDSGSDEFDAGAGSQGPWSHQVPTSICTRSKIYTIIGVIEHVPMEVSTS
jgi:hypothetical protein